MTKEYFDAPLFIKEGDVNDVNLVETPFFYNNNGCPTYVKALPPYVEPLEPASSDPYIPIGREYEVIDAKTETPDPEHGEQTKLTLVANEVVYEPMWVTSSVAAAFGITLVQKGQGIRVSSPEDKLKQIDYEYGMFAGHRSPYQGTGYRLLGVVCTDLECHDFPHVFASIDPELPLVISVARYWPRFKKIFLADLWVPSGSALYIPPRSRAKGQEFVHLHGNRNSALACWRGIERSSIQTQTLLQVDGGYFHWFWNELPTIHPLLK